jgi:TPR repeat protein
MPIALRFPIALVLSIVCLTVPAWADFQAGVEALERGDYATALSEWRPLAEQGEPYAQCSLGWLYENGYGVSQDYGQARQWYEQAAAQGNALAQRKLGELYGNGIDVPQDFVQAHKWYNLAGGNGDKYSATHRYVVESKMTPAQIAEAKKLAREWKPIKK